MRPFHGSWSLRKKAEGEVMFPQNAPHAGHYSDVHIRRLRKHLGSYANTYIETIFGVGYRFQSWRTRAPEESAQTMSLPPAPEAQLKIGELIILRRNRTPGPYIYRPGGLFYIPA